MNPHAAPSLISRPRSADEVAAVLERLFVHADFSPAGTDPLRDALVRVAARYGEIVTQCVNAAPDLHLQAFAELLGGQARPAEAAHVHVSFKPAAGRSMAPVIVPMNTRLAAPPAEGESDPVVFETLADIELVRAEATRALLVDAGHRNVADVSTMLSPAGFEGDALASALPVNNALFIAQRAAFGVAGLQQVRVQAGVLDAGSHDASALLEWVVPTPKGDLPLVVVSDGTAGLTRSGEVVLAAPSAWPAATIDGNESLWLSLRLRRVPDPTLIDASATSQAAWRPPRLSSLTVIAIAATTVQPVAAACQDGMPLDISKDVFPFGERPRFGSVFQVQSPAFAEAGAKVELRVKLTNPEGSTASPIPAVRLDGKAVVVWEISTTSGFRPVATNDGTRSLMQDGSVIFIVPADVAPIAVAGKSGPWLRARLASGHYGIMVPNTDPKIPVVYAPAIRALAVLSTLERGPLPPEILVSTGALSNRQIDPHLPLPVDAFVLPDVEGPALYIGLTATADALAKGREIDWFVRPAVPLPPLVLGEAMPAAAVPRWQMRTAAGWSDIAVRDTSAGLTQAGIVKLTLPDAPSLWQRSVCDPTALFRWLRIVWPAGVDTVARELPPIPIGLAINSVAAQQSQRLRNEVVGSSSGRSPQVFKALRTPIVGSVLLQVRETGDEWLAWQEVDDLGLSQAASRHFTLDRSTGEIRFGDGRFGRIPPQGANNIRLREYTTGGGSHGNRPAGTIAQMRSAVPFVESVTNVEPSSGGLDVEDEARVRSHASAWLRHRDRAICADDFADLALRASPEVARAYCVAGRDLGAAPPTGSREPEAQAGVISLIVVPQSFEASPQPGLALLATVKAFLDARRPPAGRLVLVGPTYASVAVSLQVVAEAGWSPHEVALACAQQLARFLHPLTGGADGHGWALGQRPHRSDIHGLLGVLDGVDLVRALSLVIDVPLGMPFIVSAGAITVAPVEPP